MNTITLEVDICRQKRLSAGIVEIGTRFVEVEEKQAEALIAMAFSDSSVCNRPEVEPKIFRSLWSVIRTFHKLFAKSRTSNRRSFRIPYRQECRLVFRDWIVTGKLDKISEEGFSVHIPGTVDLIDDRGVLYVDRFSGKIRRTWEMQDKDTVIAGFTIDRIQKGADKWRALTAQAA